MPTRIRIIYGVVVAVRIKIQTVYTLKVKIWSIVGAYEPAPLRIVVSCVEVVKPYILVVVIASVTDRVSVCKVGVGAVVACAVAPRIVFVFYHGCAAVVNLWGKAGCGFWCNLLFVWKLVALEKKKSAAEAALLKVEDSWNTSFRKTRKLHANFNLTFRDVLEEFKNYCTLIHPKFL